MHRAFTKLGRYRYLDILDDLIRCHNNKVNRKTGVAPDDDVEGLTPEQQEDIFSDYTATLYILQRLLTSLK